MTVIEAVETTASSISDAEVISSLTNSERDKFIEALNDVMFGHPSLAFGARLHICRLLFAARRRLAEGRSVCA